MLVIRLCIPQIASPPKDLMRPYLATAEIYKYYTFAFSSCNTSKSGKKYKLQNKHSRKLATKNSCLCEIRYNDAMCKRGCVGGYVSNPYKSLHIVPKDHFFFPDSWFWSQYSFPSLLENSHFKTETSKSCTKPCTVKNCIMVALEIKTEIHSLRCDPEVLTLAAVEEAVLITSVVWRLESACFFWHLASESFRLALALGQQ